MQVLMRNEIFFWFVESIQSENTCYTKNCQEFQVSGSSRTCALHQQKFENV